MSKERFKVLSLQRIREAVAPTAPEPRTDPGIPWEFRDHMETSEALHDLFIARDYTGLFRLARKLNRECCVLNRAASDNNDMYSRARLNVMRLEDENGVLYRALQDSQAQLAEAKKGK